MRDCVRRKCVSRLLEYRTRPRICIDDPAHLVRGTRNEQRQTDGRCEYKRDQQNLSALRA
jgi:hypothetical protein